MLPDSTYIFEKLEISTGSLKNIKSVVNRSHYRAIINWIEKYTPGEKASNLEKVKGLLESFSHFCQIQDWEKAKRILTFSIKTLNKGELHECLHRWGYYQEQIGMYKCLIRIDDPQLKDLVLNGLGITYHSLGDYRKAIEFHQMDLKLCQENEMVEEQISAIGNIALAHHFLKEYEQAKIYHEKCLKLIDIIKDPKKIGAIYGNLGLTYHKAKDFDNALKFQKKYFRIALETNDATAQGVSSGNLGNIYSSLGEVDKALSYYKKHLKIAISMENKWEEGAALYNLAGAYIKKSQFEKALNYAFRSLLIFDSLNLPINKILGRIQRIQDSMSWENYETAGNRQIKSLAQEVDEQSIQRLMSYIAEP